jgi:hypothetical protein
MSNTINQTFSENTNTNTDYLTQNINSNTIVSEIENLSNSINSNIESEHTINNDSLENTNTDYLTQSINSDTIVSEIENLSNSINSNIESEHTINNDPQENINTDYLTQSINSDTIISDIENLSNSINSEINDSDNSLETSITDDLFNSIIYDEENDNFNNQYKYSENIEENKDITIEKFIKLSENNNELILLINNSKKNINCITKLLFYLKKKNIKLAYNIMDNPRFYFTQIFNKLNNIYLNEYSDKICKIQQILPHINKLQIYEALNVCNFDLDKAINYLYDYDIVII